MLPPHLPAHVRSQAPKVAKHEAGHYVVGLVLGFVSDSVEINLDFKGGRWGGCSVRIQPQLESLDDVSAWVRKRVKVLYAGSLAEALNARVVREKTALDAIKVSGQDDHAKVRELVHVLRGISFPKTVVADEVQSQLDQLCLELWKAACEIVEREADLIEGLADLLVRRLKVSAGGFSAKMTTAEIGAQIPSFHVRFSVK